MKGQIFVVLNAIARSSPEGVALTQQLQSLAYQRQSKVALWKWQFCYYNLYIHDLVMKEWYTTIACSGLHNTNISLPTCSLLGLAWG